MAKFVIESPHTEEDCLKALDEATDMGVIDKYVFGCKYGEHIAWAYVEADSAEEALEENVPSFLTDNTCVHEVGKFTAEELKEAHQ